ncbi:MAG: tRNA-specific adenosine deaminase, partial [Thalassospira sp.]|nr:tRNA-specific adenosine deaminase [Thalassospira sp.]
DAAAIGFDDQFLYDEVAKPIPDRSLPCEHLDLGEARDVFAAWDAKEDKIAY